MNKPIYLDFNATTPVDPRVFSAMETCFKDCFGNPSSLNHSYGWEGESKIKKARTQVATLIGCEPGEVIFTSGATESNNLGIYGFLKQFRNQPHHLITSAAEHKAVLDVAQMCKSDLGTQVTILTPDNYGQISPSQLEAAIRPQTKLVSLMAANNEIGTINPIAELSALCRKQGICFHTDAAQAAGKIAVDLQRWPCDLVSLSAHKMYGPKGVGALFVRKNVKSQISPLMAGGGQEYGLRPGTYNVPGIVGFGAACEIAQLDLAKDQERLTQLRDQFLKRVLSEIPTARLNGHPKNRIYSNVSLSFANLPADVFALGLSGLALSSGSACSTGQISHVLRAIGLDEKLAKSTIRIGLGRTTTSEELEIAFQKILALAKKSSDFN